MIYLVTEPAFHSFLSTAPQAGGAPKKAQGVHTEFGMMSG